MTRSNEDSCCCFWWTLVVAIPFIIVSAVFIPRASEINEFNGVVTYVNCTCDIVRYEYNPPTEDHSRSYTVVKLFNCRGEPYYDYIRCSKQYEQCVAKYEPQCADNVITVLGYYGEEHVLRTEPEDNDAYRVALGCGIVACVGIAIMLCSCFCMCENNYLDKADEAAHRESLRVRREVDAQQRARIESQVQSIITSVQMVAATQPQQQQSQKIIDTTNNDFALPPPYTAAIMSVPDEV